MKKDKRFYFSIVYIVIGVVLFGISFAGMVDEFWSGMGSAFFVIGFLRLLRFYRFQKNDAYREMIETEEKDERNHFLRNKAWAWAGYMYVIIMAVATIIFKIIGQEVLMMAASCSVCLVLVLFWISYYILRRKY